MRTSFRHCVNGFLIEFVCIVQPLIHFLGRYKPYIIQVHRPFYNTAGNKKIFPAIIIEIGKQRCPAPVSRRNTSLQRYIAEAVSVSIVLL